MLVYPQPGWTQANTGDPAHLQLQNVAVFDLRIYTAANVNEADATALIENYVGNVLSNGASQLQLSSREQVAINGVTGVRQTYVGNFGNLGVIEGQVTAFFRGSASSGLQIGILVDAWAPQGQLAAREPDIEQMIQTVEVQ